MLPDEPDYIPYAPGARTLEVVRRLHEGKTSTILSRKNLISLGIAEGNADRVQKALRFLGLISPEYELTEDATRLRKATSEEYPATLAELVRRAYSPIFLQYDPAVATGIDLNNAFKPYDPPGQRDNMIGLFMALCRESALASEAATPPRRGRPPAGTTTKPRQEPARQSTASRPAEQRPPPPPANGRTNFAEMLLAKFPDFNPEWDTEVQQKWFDGIAKLQEHLK